MEKPDGPTAIVGNSHNSKKFHPCPDSGYPKGLGLDNPQRTYLTRMIYLPFLTVQEPVSPLISNMAQGLGVLRTSIDTYPITRC
jgi:hypothetical protein